MPTFEEQIQHLCAKYLLDAHDLTGAYKDKQDSLAVFFKVATDNKSSDGSVTALSLFMNTVAMFAPLLYLVTVPATVALYGSADAGVCRKDQEIGNVLRNGIDEWRLTQTQSIPSPPH